MSDDRVISGRLARLSRLAAMAPKAGLALARGLAGQEDDTGGVGGVLSDTLGKLKGGSLKLGQLLAQVGDDLPAGARLRLGELYASAPPLSADALAAALEEELGAPPERCFSRFDRSPFAAASLGQVHAATLPGGEEVAVKIQYPGAEEALQHDLALLAGAVGSASLGGALMDTRGFLVALRDATLAELDYEGERARLERMRAALAPWPDLVVPRVWSERSSRRVLTLERLPGPTLHAWMDQPQPAEARAAIGRLLVRAVLGPTLRSGMVNADAHPGNFLVGPDGRLGLVDFGAVVAVDPGIVAGLGALMSALVGDRRPSPEAARGLLEGAGMPLRLPPDRARRFAGEILDILWPAFRGPWDFSRDSRMGALGRLKQERPLDTLGGRPRPELLPILRALIGLHHALARLATPVDVRAELVALLGPEARACA